MYEKIRLHHHKEPILPDVLDTVIIGAGPAGMTAAIYAARRKMKTLMICGTIGGQMNACSDIQNWTGVAKATGPELVKSFFEHVVKIDDDDPHFDLWLKEGLKVNTVCKQKNGLFGITAEDGKEYVSKTVILTMGKRPRMLGIPGEDIAMRGNGLSLSATSDAPLYRGKKMVVIGGGNSAMDVTLQLAKFTDDITLITMNDALGGTEALQERVQDHANVTILKKTLVQEILLNENNKVRGVRYKTADNDCMMEMECEGIFEQVGQVPSSECVCDMVTLNDMGEIITDRNCRTNIDGCYAGGDINNGDYKQVIVASGEGAVCALEAHKYILEHKST